MNPQDINVECDMDLKNESAVYQPRRVWVAGGKAGMLGFGCPSQRGLSMPSILFQSIPMRSAFASPKGAETRLSPQCNSDRVV